MGKNTQERAMTLKQMRMAALTATFLTGSAALVYAQSSSTVGAGGSSAGGGTSSSTIGTGGSAAGGGTGSGSSSTLGTGGSSAGMSNSGTNKKTGLDRADEVAGKHGQQGRRNAREHQRNRD
jgi:hypothetical protein